jgi:ketosteroid isomerase-like protein
VLRTLVDGVAAERFSDLARLYARQTDVTHPFSAGSKPLRSRSDLEEHFGAMAAAQARLPRREVIDLVIYETTDPEVVVAEFAYRWMLPEPMSVGCVLVTRVRDGEIVESRDYADPSAMAQVAQRLRKIGDSDR